MLGGKCVKIFVQSHKIQTQSMTLISDVCLLKNATPMINAENNKMVFKIEIARQLLLNNSLNISEVAYETGFNDPKYFSKCFKNTVGLSPIEYRKMMKYTSNEAENKSFDECFVEKAILKLEMRIADVSLSINQLASEMNVSKVSLYRKFKSTVGLSPCEYILSVRIKRSVQLLAKEQNISDIAFSVGFNDPKYFSRCFKSEYGITPRQFQSSSRIE